MSDFTPYLPDDFDDFWADTVDEVKSLPVDYKRSWTNDFRWPGFKVETLTFASVGGRRLNGWIAIPDQYLETIASPSSELQVRNSELEAHSPEPRVQSPQSLSRSHWTPKGSEEGSRSVGANSPESAEANLRRPPESDPEIQSTLKGSQNRGKLPAFLWIPPYGRESLLPNEYGTREGFVSLSFNFFGEPAFHEEKYRMDRGYFSEGAEDPRTWVFRRMFQDAYMAFRVLQEQFEVDENRCASMGMSQGAGLSIWLGAWCEGVKAVCADMPFLCAIKHTLLQTVHRYPLKELTDFMHRIPLGEERVLNTVAYFDTMNQATRCKVPTHVTLGLKDPAARPDNVRAMYRALAADRKELLELDCGHDWHPEMIETNRDWLLKHL
jgi:cephalosporin-C deacetylase